MMVKNESESPRQIHSIPQGQRVFTCGHSFHYWVADILADMASGAGIFDHQIEGKSIIGGSRVVQHWDLPDDQNDAKKALRAGIVDVLTLSPIWLPDEGIGLFLRLALDHNPNARVTIQEFWLPNDTYEAVYPLQTWKHVDHNSAAISELRKCHNLYFHDMDELVCHLNEQLGINALLIVPAGQAVLALRENIITGKAPGLSAQSDLFCDSWGHPTAPVQALTAYCHFAVIYRQSPVGLPLPEILARDPKWCDSLNRMLQELAWDAVVGHPFSGIGAAAGKPN